MYTISTVAAYIKNLIENERKLAYLAIAIVLIGVAMGTFIGWILNKADFLDIMVKLGGLGISITSLTALAYQLFKHDGMEERKHSFCKFVEEQANDKTLVDTTIKKAKIHDILLDILKNKLSEDVIKPKLKTDE